MFTKFNLLSKSHLLQRFTKLFFFAFFFTLFLWSQSVSSQNFLKSYSLNPWWPGGSGSVNDAGYSIKPALNSTDWTVAGYSYGLFWAAFSDDWMFLKLDPSGNVLCSAILGFGAMRDDRCNSHINFPGANAYILSGYYTPYYFHQPNTNFNRKASWSMIDDNCNLIQSKVINDTGSHEYKAVTEVSPNNFVNAGYIERFDPPSGVTSSQALVSKYDLAGNLVWANTYILRTLPMPPPFAPAVDTAYSVCYQPKDNTYGVTGTITAPGALIQTFAMKLNSAGVPIWSMLYGAGNGVGTVPTEGRKIIPLPDGGFVIGGFFSSTVPPPSTVGRYSYLLKINAAGNIVASSMYLMNQGFRNECYSMVYLPSEDKIVFTGSKYNPITVNDDILLCKVDAKTPTFGVISWSQIYNNGAGNDKGYDISTYTGTTGNEFALTGELFNGFNGSTDAFLMKADNSGNIPGGCLSPVGVTQKAVFQQVALNVSTEADADEIIEPVLNNPPYDETIMCQGDLHRPTGNNEENQLVPDRFTLEQNYPNPFNPSTVIKFGVPVDGNVSIKVYDLTGKEVISLLNGFKAKGYYTVNFDGTNLPSGVYFYKMEVNGFTETKKMLMIK